MFQRSERQYRCFLYWVAQVARCCSTLHYDALCTLYYVMLRSCYAMLHCNALSLVLILCGTLYLGSTSYSAGAHSSGAWMLYVAHGCCMFQTVQSWHTAVISCGA